MPGVFPDYPAPVMRNTGTERELDHDALGYAATAAHRRAAGHQHPQHLIAALARLAEAGKPLPGAVQQLRGVRAGAEPGDEEKGRGLVRAQRRSAADLLRRHLDRVQGRPRHEIETDPGPPPRLRLPDDLAERGGRADPPEGHAGDPDDRRGARRLDARAMG